MKTKLMYIFSSIDNSHAFEWMAEYTDTRKFDVHYVFMNPQLPPIAKRMLEKGFAYTFH